MAEAPAEHNSVRGGESGHHSPSSYVYLLLSLNNRQVLVVRKHVTVSKTCASRGLCPTPSSDFDGCRPGAGHTLSTMHTSASTLRCTHRLPRGVAKIVPHRAGA